MPVPVAHWTESIILEIQASSQKQRLPDRRPPSTRDDRPNLSRSAVAAALARGTADVKGAPAAAHARSRRSRSPAARDHASESLDDEDVPLRDRRSIRQSLPGPPSTASRGSSHGRGHSSSSAAPVRSAAAGSVTAQGGSIRPAAPSRDGRPAVASDVPREPTPTDDGLSNIPPWMRGVMISAGVVAADRWSQPRCRGRRRGEPRARIERPR